MCKIVIPQQGGVTKEPLYYNLEIKCYDNPFYAPEEEPTQNGMVEYIMMEPGEIVILERTNGVDFDGNSKNCYIEVRKINGYTRLYCNAMFQLNITEGDIDVSKTYEITDKYSSRITITSIPVYE